MSQIEHILITAGGTIEAIDGVRQISNTSTGSLCACIYSALADTCTAAKTDCEFMVHYVVSEKALRPDIKDSLPVTFYPVTDVASVETVIDKLMAEHNISYVIHGMAVSDFAKDYLIERGALIDELSDTLGKALDKSRDKLTGEQLRELIGNTLKCPKRRLDSSVKVSSKVDLMLALKRTPKLIEKFKKLNPECFLVGFKLLKGVSEEELVRVASELSHKNGCDLVLANDMNSIQNGRHEGLLIRDKAVVGRYGTKQDIAGGIVRRMLGNAEIKKDGSCI